MRPDWQRLGLRHNPFENVEPGARNDWVDVPSAVRQALELRPIRLELRGSRGAGKSTLLRKIASLLPDAQLRLAGARDRLTPLFAAPWTALLIDEADVARTPAELARAFHEAAATGANLILASHRWMTSGRPERWVRVDLDVERALGWIALRVAAAALPGAVPPPFTEIGERLHALLGGVNYVTQRALYELAEELARGTDAATAELRAIARARAEPVGH